MARGETRFPRRIRPRRIHRKANAEHNPLDEVSKIPTDPRYLVLHEGRLVDGRPGSMSYDPYPFNGVPERFPSPPSESDG
jgi:hypothetical protein